MVNWTGMRDTIIRATLILNGRQDDWSCGGGDYLQLLLGVGGGLHSLSGDAKGAGHTNSNKCNQRAKQLRENQDGGQLATCLPQLAKTTKPHSGTG